MLEVDMEVDKQMDEVADPDLSAAPEEACLSVGP